MNWRAVLATYINQCQLFRLLIAMEAGILQGSLAYHKNGQQNIKNKYFSILSYKNKFYPYFLLTVLTCSRRHSLCCRDVAQSGSALEWGSRGRRFKSFHPDH